MGWARIYPAIANTVMMFDVLGYARGPPGCGDGLERGAQAVGDAQDDEAYCQPCLSPVWDTSLSGHAVCRGGNQALGEETPTSHGRLRLAEGSREVNDVMPATGR